MLAITLCSFVLLCTTTFVHNYQDAFDRICIPNEACYYVSRYETTYEEAQAICQQKTQQYSSPFTERDKAILKPWGPSLKEDQYWVVDPSEGSGLRNQQRLKIRFRIRLRGFVRRGPARIGLVKIARLRQIILTMLIRYSQFLEESRWEDFLNYYEENKRAEIVEKLKAFILLVRQQDYDNIDIETIRFVTDVIAKMVTFKIRYLVTYKTDMSQQQLILDNALRYIAFLEDIDWEDLTKRYGGPQNLEIINKLKIFIGYIRNRQIDKIDNDLLQFIGETFKTIVRIKIRILFDNESEEDREQALIDTSNKYLLLLQNLQWENLLEHVEESKRSAILEKIRLFINLVRNRDFGKINLQFIHSINQIITSLGTLRIRITFKIKTGQNNDNAVYETGLNYLKFLQLLNWENLVENFNEDDRPEIIARIKLFIRYVQNREINNLNLDLLAFIHQIVTNLRTLKMRETCGCNSHEKEEEEDAEEYEKVVRFLIRVKWSQLINRFKESQRNDIAAKIKLFMKFVENKEYNRIDKEFYDYIIKVVEYISKFSKDENENENEKYAYYVRTVGFLQNINWENLLGHFEENIRNEILTRIRLIIRFVQNKEYDKIDENMHNFITKIVIRFKQVKEDHDKGQNDEDRNIEIVRFVKFLLSIGWENLVKNFEENKRAEILEKIRLIIRLVQNREFDKINSDLYNYVTKITIRFRRVKEDSDKGQDVDNRNTAIVRVIKFLQSIGWENLLGHFEENIRNEILTRIRLIIRFVQNKEYDKIDENMHSFITKIVIRFKQVKEDHDKGQGDNDRNTAIVRFVKFLLSIGWENLVKNFEENKRAEILEKIRLIIRLVQNREFDKINSDLYNYVTKITIRFKQVKEDNDKVVSGDRNSAVINIIRFLMSIKWEDVVRHFEESNRAEILEKIRLIIRLVQNKEFDKINEDLRGFITKIVIRFKVAKEEHDKGKCDHDEKSVALIHFIKFLKNIRWESLVKHFEENKRTEIIERIRLIIKLVQNKEFNKIDENLHKFITDIIIRFKKVKEDSDRNKGNENKGNENKGNENKGNENKGDSNKGNENKGDVIKDGEKEKKQVVSIDFVKYLQEIDWEKLINQFEENKRDEIRAKIKLIIKYVLNKDYDKINADLYNFINEIIIRFKAIVRVKVSTKEIINRIQVNLPSNWIDLVKRIQGIDQTVWIERIKLILSNNKETALNVDWADQLQRVIDLIIQEDLKFKKESVLNDKSVAEFNEKIRKLKEWNWVSFLVYLDESQRAQISTDINKVINLADSKQLEKLDIQYFNWFNQMFQTFSRINEAISNGFTFNSKTKTWEKKEVQVVESGNVKTVLDQNTIEDLKNKINQLIKMDWQSFLVYIDENNRPQIGQEINNLITIINKKEFGKIDLQTANWFLQTFNVFSQMYEAVKNGYAFNFKTRVWMKKVVVDKNSRKKRGLLSGVANLIRGVGRTIGGLFGARSRLRVRVKFGHESQGSNFCTYVKKIDDEFIIKYTNCEEKQQFICKADLNQ